MRILISDVAVFSYRAVRRISPVTKAQAQRDLARLATEAVPGEAHVDGIHRWYLAQGGLRLVVAESPGVRWVVQVVG